MPSRPIDIAIDLSCLVPQPLTGVGYYTLNLVRALIASQRAPRLHVLATSARPVTGCVRDVARTCASLRTLRWPTRLKNAMWTRVEWPPIERFTGPVDVAHGAFHLLPAARRAKRVTTVFDLSGVRYPDTHPSASTKTHWALLRHAAARADALIAISRSCKEDAVELLGAPPEKVHVVYGGVDIDEFEGPRDRAAAARLGIEGEYFVHLGTLEPRKNLPRLLEAYAGARARCPACPKLVLAGKAGWMCGAVFETIERLNLAGQVIHTRYLPREEAVHLLRGAYACVYPSLYEGFGLPVLEAMAARVPVLTSNVSSLPEVAGDTGLLVDPESVEAIEAGLMALIEERGGALRRADAAYDRARTFTWARSADTLAGVYEMLVED